MGVTKLEFVGERRIEVFYGGSRDGVIRKTCELAADAAQSLAEGETVLYLNVLSSEALLEHELQKVCRSRGGAETRHKMLAMTVMADDLLSHTTFIEKTIESRGVRLVVLNTFDFAAMTPRRRTRLVAFLQQLRDFSHVDIAVGLRREPKESDTGSYAALAFQAARVMSLTDVSRFTVGQTAEEISTDTKTEDSRTAIVLRPYALHVELLKSKELTPLRATPLQEYLAAA